MTATRVLVLLGALTFSQVSLANDLLSSAKSLLGTTEESTSTLSVTDMVSSVSDSLGITTEQATGSLGSIFDYAKDNISADQLTTLSDSLPGLDTLLDAVPEVSSDDSETSTSSLGGLMSTAAKYSDSLSSIAALQSQFEALGLDADMITQVIQSAYTYLDSEQGEEVKALLQTGLSSLQL
jgi:hypothetical protein